jgi:hypothetical protein
MLPPDGRNGNQHPLISSVGNWSTQRKITAGKGMMSIELQVSMMSLDLGVYDVPGSIYVYDASISIIL